MIWVLLQSELPWQQRQDNKASIPVGSCPAHDVAPHWSFTPPKELSAIVKLSWKQITFWNFEHTWWKTQKIPPKQEKDWMGTQSSPHTLQVQNGGPVNLI